MMKVRVTATPALAAMRSPAAIAKVTEVGRDRVKITSFCVCNVIPP